eukprot:COSAG02_NODE_4007_length_5920_cov_5.932829_2_plen_95_part_00
MVLGTGKSGGEGGGGGGGADQVAGLSDEVSDGRGPVSLHSALGRHAPALQEDGDGATRTHGRDCGCELSSKTTVDVLTLYSYQCMRMMRGGSAI